MLITPNPFLQIGLEYIPVCRYEYKLLVAEHQPLSNRLDIDPGELSQELLVTSPVDMSGLDIYGRFYPL